MLVVGINTIAVVTMNQDQWAFFDLQLTAQFDPLLAVSGACLPACGARGQCINGQCVCDNGWGNSDCKKNLCTYTDSTSSTVIPAGSSFRNMQWGTVSSTPVGWFSPTFDDSWWPLASAPFGSQQYSGCATTINAVRHLYRNTFLIEIPFDQVVQNATLLLASDDTHRVYLNGKFLNDPVFPYNSHTAQYWNEVLVVDGSLFTESENVIAIEVPLVDGRWTTYFDMMLTVHYSTKTCAPPS